MPTVSASSTLAGPLDGRTRSTQRVLARRTARLRWDRVGRVAMLFVMAALVYLYLSAGVSLLSTWRESKRIDSQVAVLNAEHEKLTFKHRTLSSSAAMESQARQLGMQFPNERTYVVKGLPEN